MTYSESEITGLLASWRAGNSSAEEQLLRIIYPRLKAIAANRLKGAGASISLQTTDLVHEAFLRLVGQEHTSWANRGHFFAISARLMRRILVDHHRRRKAAKRGGREILVSLDELPALIGEPATDWIRVDESLRRLGSIDPVAERVVELRHFSGLKVEEVVEVLGVSRATGIRKWRFAKAWLKNHLEGSP